MLLDLPLVLETRRNHALEHATIHLLARRRPKQRMMGHSNPTGFFLFGKFETPEIWMAATEALERLRAGERALAIHPGCGTNLAAMALLAGTLSWMVLRGARSTLMRIVLLPFAVSFAILGLLLARPFGPWLQEHITTEPDPGPLQILDIIPLHKNIHRVITR